MDDLASAPESVATDPVVETPAVARAPDGTFAPKPSPVDPGATPEAEGQPQVEALKDEPRKDDPEKRKSAQERINRITAEKHAAMREAAALRQRLEAMHNAPRAQVDPSDYEGQQREQFRSVMREETQQQTASQYQDAVAKAMDATRETFFAKVESVRDRIPDIDQSLQAFARLPLSNDVCELIAESDVAGELAHHLAKNPRIATELQGMTPAQQGRALARIESQLSLPTRRTSSAPPPPPSVTGATAATTRGLSDMSIADMQRSLKKSGVIR